MKQTTIYAIIIILVLNALIFTYKDGALFIKTEYMEKEQAIQIVEDQIYLADIAENEYSQSELKKVLTYLKRN
jgi:uncharacterized membrane protein